MECGQGLTVPHDEATIRPALQEDLPALGALKLRASLAWGDHTAELLALPEARQVPAEHLPYAFVAADPGDGGRVLGFATLLPADGLDAEIEDLFVDPAAWRQGVGRRLLAEAERRARAHGFQALHVIANTRALPFYEAAGFQVIGTVETMFAPAPEMRKALEPRG